MIFTLSITNRLLEFEFAAFEDSTLLCLRLCLLFTRFRFQREERETLNQLARRLASGSHGLMGGHTAASMIQHLVYRHPNGMPSSDQILVPINSRRPADVESPPGSSRSGDETPLGHEYPPENECSGLTRKGEAQSWTFEEQFRQVMDSIDNTTIL